ncbi:MAG: S24/S26 family peptidase [Pseudomonadota bacterium]
MLTRYQAVGQSMAPLLPDGATFFALRWPARWLRPGQRVVVAVAEGVDIVKRIASVDGHHVVLASDNRTTRSRYCGVPLPIEQIRGRVLTRAHGGRLSPPAK